MPVYDFKCPKCNLKFERSLKIDDTYTKIECPSCSEVSNKLPPKNVLGIVAESTSIPKDIDKVVGKDAEERWQEYEEKKKVKEKLRQDLGTQRLAKDLDGDYVPLEMTKDGQKVSEKEGVELRKEMFKDFNEIKKDPETQKIEVPE